MPYNEEPMTLLDSIILGALEGFTEFLPISSTGHLILAAELLGIPSTEFVKSFMIAVQLGAIAAVVILYWKKFLDIEVIKRLIVGFIPTGIIGFTLYQVVKDYLIGNSLIVVTALFVGGIALILFEFMHKESEDEAQEIRTLPYKQVALVGVFQSLAMIPGVSRSAATIVGGLLLGMRRTTIVEFSFLLAVPTMVAATGYDILKSYDSFPTDGLELLAVGFVVSLIVALLSMRLLISFVKKHTFVPFGIYRIVLAALFFLFVLA